MNEGDERKALLAKLPAAGIVFYRLGRTPGVVLVRHPARLAPKEGELTFVDLGDANGWREKPRIALYRGGRWRLKGGKPLPIEPTFWTTFKTKRVL
jgi:hypothetical protein